MANEGGKEYKDMLGGGQRVVKKGVYSRMEKVVRKV